MEFYTIGYEGLTRDQFLKWLHFYDISLVADVRELPFSRKKGFSKKALSEMLSREDIQYVNFRELGTSKEMRRELKEHGDYAGLFEKYKNKLANHIDLLDKILSLIHNGERVLLLCYERNPQLCHRKVLSEEIEERDGNGLSVKHLNPLL